MASTCRSVCRARIVGSITVLSMTAVATLVVGLVLGWFARTFMRVGRSATPRRVEPMEQAIYLAQREELRRSYTSSMNEYDRLVTWISGGALGLSVTFIERFAPKTRADTAWMLMWGWSLLAAA